MRVVVISTPEPFVTIEEARQHIVDLPVEDETYVKGLILAATTWIDGPTGWLGRALGVQTLEALASDFHASTCDWDGIKLPFYPAIDIVSVSYRNESGSIMNMPPDDYELIDDSLLPVDGVHWPIAASRPNSVRIRYRAGYGKLDESTPQELVNDVPAPIKVAILMIVAQWYRLREPIVVGAEVQEVPFAAEVLLHSYKVYR